MSIGENVKIYREARELSIEKFAQKLGITPAECRGIECGRRILSSSEIQRICRILDITIEDLLSSRQATKQEEEGSILMPIDELQNLLGKMKE